jgi:hypothetical protein
MNKNKTADKVLSLLKELRWIENEFYSFQEWWVKYLIIYKNYHKHKNKKQQKAIIKTTQKHTERYNTKTTHPN